MSSKVSGYLAGDGTFFEREPECRRHEAMQKLGALCESHGTNFENFLVLLNTWHQQIKEYYNADQKCKERQIGKAEFGAGTFDHKDIGAFDDYDDHGDDIPAFLQPESDNPDPSIGDKDAPAFLEQQIRRRERVSNIRNRSHAKAVPAARKSDGS